MYCDILIGDLIIMRTFNDARQCPASPAQREPIQALWRS